MIQIKNKKEFLLLAIALIQIFLLINMTPSYSYIIHQTDSSNQIDSVENSKTRKELKNLLNLGVNLLINFLSIKQIGSVSATETQWCCPKTNGGAVCQDIPAGDSSSCSEKPLTTSCKMTNRCKTGTCLDKEEGICSAGTKSECEGNWNSLPIYDVAECKFGCCTLNDGINKEYVRQVKCIKEKGIFDSSVPQTECKRDTGEMGACVIKKENEKECKFTTTEDCKKNLKGIFYKSSLCSNPELETKCGRPLKKADIKTICNDNKVYFLDSCENLANVYDISKWNNENYWKTVQTPICQDDNWNIKSAGCGDCNGLNSICDSSSKVGGKPAGLYGNFICKDLNCGPDEVFNKKFLRNPLNQESWCVYESYVGDSRDVVGSAHWLRYCDRGEIKTELCDEYRTKICGEKIIEEGGKQYSEARCRANEGWKCYLENSNLEKYKFIGGDFVADAGVIIKRDTTYENNNKTCTDASSDCRLQSVDFYSGPSTFIKNLHIFDSCVPKYPPGLQFWSESSNAQGLCGTINSAKCTTKWEYAGTWYCKGNCECMEPEYENLGWKTKHAGFAEQMNELCASLGDCGGKVNILGVYTKNFKSSSLEDFKPYIYVGGKETYALKELVDFVWRKYTLKGDISEDKIKEYKSYADESNIGKGDIPEFLTNAELNVFEGNPLENIGYTGGEFPKIAQNALQYTSIALGAVSGVLIAIVAPAVTSWAAGLASSFGITASAWGIVTSTSIAIPSTVSSAAAAAVAVPIVGWVIAAIAAVIAAIMMILQALGFWDTKEIVIEFDCQPWQAPIGGKDCKKCNEGGLPCTEYKCKSLGADCETVKDTYESQNPICISTSLNDITPPQIVFDSIEYEESYNIEDINNGVKINSLEISGCIQEFSQINFTLKTKDGKDDDYAKCVYNWKSNVELPSPSNNYELIGENFKEGTFNSITHTFDTRLPFLTSPYISDISGELGEKKGDLTMYVRCIDPSGNTNINEYFVKMCIREGPDKTAANIMEYLPERGSYLPYGINASVFTILLDEPAECRFSYDTDKAYDNMENFTLGMSIPGCEKYNAWELKSRWVCSTLVKDLIKTENDIYIKCKDQPWVLDPDYKGAWHEEDRNVNEEGFLYNLYSTPSELIIDSISPQGEIIKESGTSEIELSAITSGGAYDGNADCSYEFITPMLGFDSFFQTGTTEHRQPHLNLGSEDYNISIKCTDKVGNPATGNAVFSLLLDEEAPKVVRAYKDETYLKLVTDELAECRYKTNYEDSPCDYSFENGTAMNDINGNANHYTNWNPQSTFYIICQDKYENKPTGCSAIIRPSNFPSESS